MTSLLDRPRPARCLHVKGTDTAAMTLAPIALRLTLGLLLVLLFIAPLWSSRHQSAEVNVDDALFSWVAISTAVEQDSWPLPIAGRAQQADSRPLRLLRASGSLPIADLWGPHEAAEPADAGALAAPASVWLERSVPWRARTQLR